MPAIALTDHGALYGASDFYVAANQAGIKPILGRGDVHRAHEPLRARSAPRGSREAVHLVLLAKGFHGGYRQPRLAGHDRAPRRLLLPPAHGQGDPPPALDGSHRAVRVLAGRARAPRSRDEGIEAACKVALEHQEIFGAGNYFLELMQHGVPEQEAVLAGVREVARRTGIPLVATNDIHYVHARGRRGAGRHGLHPERQDDRYAGPPQDGSTTPSLYLKSAEQMATLFPDDREALENTLRIAEMVDIKLPLGELQLPAFDVPAGVTPEEHLRPHGGDRRAREVRGHHARSCANGSTRSSPSSASSATQATSSSCRTSSATRARTGS